MIPRPLGGALAALALLSTSLVGAGAAGAAVPDRVPTAAPLAALLGALPAATAVAPDDLLLHYGLTETYGTLAADSSGNGRDGVVVGAATWTGAAVDLPGGPNNAAYVRLPDGLLTGVTEASVSVEVKPDASALSRPSFLWNLGGTSDTGSWFTSTNGTLRSTITPSNWSGEQNAAWTSPPACGRTSRRRSPTTATARRP
jgi:hypothetical protein